MVHNQGTAPPSTQTFSDHTTYNQAGAAFRNITVIGDRLSTADQNALVFYGKTEFAYVDNCVVSYVRGHAFFAGARDSSGKGYFSESRLQNCHFDHSGDGVSNPSVEITANGTTVNASTNLDLGNLRLFDSYGPGLWIHQSAVTTNNT